TCAPPILLLSMPQLVDPNFNRTVVLLCKQSEEGAFGLIVNRPLVTTGRIVVNLDPPVEQPDHDLQVWVGGPVEPERHWILVGDEPDDDQQEIGRASCRERVEITKWDGCQRVKDRITPARRHRQPCPWPL